jgi:hypothetical protein
MLTVPNKMTQQLEDWTVAETTEEQETHNKKRKTGEHPGPTTYPSHA